MNRLAPLAIIIALVLAGCSGAGDSTGPPSIPDIAGAYQGEFTESVEHRR